MGSQYVCEFQVYSIGVGDDAEFEKDMLALGSIVIPKQQLIKNSRFNLKIATTKILPHTGCQVFAYDRDSVKGLEDFSSPALRVSKKAGNEMTHPPPKK